MLKAQGQPGTSEAVRCCCVLITELPVWTEAGDTRLNLKSLNPSMMVTKILNLGGVVSTPRQGGREVGNGQ